MTLRLISFLLVSAVLFCTRETSANWSVVPRGLVALDTAAVSGVNEMSGVTYLGDVGGKHLFAAVQDSGSQLVTFEATFAVDGTLQSAVAKSTLALSPGFDFEGIVFAGSVRNSVLVSEESTPAIREYSLSTGMQIQTVALPGVFSSARANFALESLTQSVGRTTLWTANEEALTIDGSLSNSTTGTVVRLQQFAVGGGIIAAGAQYAYNVDPVHAGNPNRSGLVDMVSLPDGTLLALERSAASAIPAFLNKIYQIDFAEATDISHAQFDAGLQDAVYQAVGKTLLWSGSFGGVFGISGENLEGLSLGPQLSDGSWVLLGVVDSGDDVSGNTVVALRAIPPACDLAGDYNCSGVVDTMDLAVWRDAFGTSEYLFADGSADGVVNLADYTLWRDHLGGAQPTTQAEASMVAEPPSALTCFLVAMMLGAVGRVRRE